MTISNNEFSFPSKKVMIVDANDENNAALKTWFTSQKNFQLIGIYQSPQIAIREITNLSPEIVLVGIDIPNGIKFCKILRKKNASVCIVALVRTLDSESQVSIRQSGALESLVRGASPDLIGQTLQSVTAIEGSAMCSIIGVGGIKEGMATTLLTCILGDFLGRDLPGNVLLVDLDFRRGDLAFSLGQPAKKHIQELVAMENFLHFENLQKYITQTPRGFSLLASAQEPGLKILSDIAFVGLLTALGNFFETILIDLPPYPFQGLSGVIDICDKVIINVGDTQNQMKTLWWLKNSDWKKLPKSYIEKQLFVSWCQEPKDQAELEGILPQCVFLPKPQKILFKDPASTINDSAEYETLRVALGTLLEKIPGLSLYSKIGSSSLNGRSSGTSIFWKAHKFLFGD